MTWLGLFDLTIRFRH